MGTARDVPERSGETGTAWCRGSLAADLRDTEARKNIREPVGREVRFPNSDGRVSAALELRVATERQHRAGGERQRERRMRPLPSRSQSMEMLSLRARVMRKSVWGVVPLS